MSRTAKIAVAGMVGGLLMTLTVGMALRDGRPVTQAAVTVREPVADPLERDLRRCRTLTMPESGCEAAWEEKRRRFFRREERP